MSPDPKRIRLDLDEWHARGLHAAIREALNAQLLTGELAAAARDVLEQLDRRVPGWLQAGPIGGEAGYLVAAEAVLRTLVAAEDGGRRLLTETELLRALGDAKPLGSTADDVMQRMTREKLITINRRHEEASISATSAGRRFVHRDTAAQDDTWVVRDYNALLDLIYAEHRAGSTGHRPSVQAIGRLEDRELGELADSLIGFDLLQAPDVPVSASTWLELTAKGVDLARERWKDAAPPGVYRSSLDHPPAPPLPFQRRLPLRIGAEDRLHPQMRDWQESCSYRPVAWLTRSSKTKLFATLKRDGAVQWTCKDCTTTWLVYLQAFTRDDTPAYGEPSAGAYNRPLWRPTYRYG